MDVRLCGSRDFIEKLRRDYSLLRPVIEGRLEEFRRVDKSDAGRLFEELVFCVLTPQSSARRADAAVKELSRKGLILNGRARDIYSVLRRWGVRFPATKARYIILNRRALMGGEKLKQLLCQDGRETRDKLVKVVWGMGYKEASHFLRNIGYGGLAIIDRHVMRGLVRIGVLERKVNVSSRRMYLMVEEKFIEAAEIVGVQPEALDLLLWFEETGEVFK